MSLEEFLKNNKFASHVEDNYKKSIGQDIIGVVIDSGKCHVFYNSAPVWQGEAGQDAIGVISEYLDL